MNFFADYERRMAERRSAPVQKGRLRGLYDAFDLGRFGPFEDMGKSCSEQTKPEAQQANRYFYHPNTIHGDGFVIYRTWLDWVMA